MKCIPWMMAALLVSQFTAIGAFPADVDSVLATTDGRNVRAVWVRVVDPDDEQGKSKSARLLIGWDAERNQERVLSWSTSHRIAYPHFVDNGNGVVYTDSVGVCRVDWRTGSKETILGSRVPISAVWRDSETGKTWLYGASWGTYGSSLKRICLQSPNEAPEVIWDSPLPDNTPNDFQILNVSRNGEYIGGMFNPHLIGILHISSGAFHALCTPQKRYGGGCCGGHMAPDKSLLLMSFTSDHMHLNLTQSVESGQPSLITTLRIAEAIANATGRDASPEGIANWTNDPEYLISSGPSSTALIEVTQRSSVRLIKLSNDLSSILKVFPLSPVDKTTGDELYPSGRIEIPFPVKHFRVNTISMTLRSASDTPVDTTISLLSVVDRKDIVVCKVTAGNEWLHAEPVFMDSSWKLNLSASDNTPSPAVLYGRVDVVVDGKLDVLTVYYEKDYSPDSAFMRIVPDKIEIAVGDTGVFFPDLRDRKNDPLMTSYSWSTNGGGHIDSQGRFVSDGTQGTFEITLKPEGMQGMATAQVTVIEDTTTHDSDIVILHPQGAMVLEIGDTCEIRWKSYVELASGVELYISPDQGVSWCPVNSQGAILPSSANWGKFNWIIPDSISCLDTKLSLSDTECHLRVAAYDGTASALTSSPFLVNASSPTRMPARTRKRAICRLIQVRGTSICLDSDSDQLLRYEVISAVGKRVAYGYTSGDGLITGPLPSGIYLSTVRNHAGEVLFRGRTLLAR